MKTYDREHVKLVDQKMILTKQRDAMLAMCKELLRNICCANSCGRRGGNLNYCTCGIEKLAERTQSAIALCEAGAE